jgi:rhodanese-related sulfurtransferase
VAYLLQKEGFKVFVITGGLRAWRKAGQALEPVPHDDVVKLPMFT